MDIVLDTNILHQEGLFSRNMQLLGRLALEKQVSIYVPELVKREYVSKRITESTEKFQSIQTGLADMVKKLDRDNAVYLDINRTQAAVTEIAKSITVAIEEDFERWRSTNHVTILPTVLTSAIDVFDDYFNGAGVFRKAKSREDLPDAFINACLQALLSEKKNLYVIMKDGTFRKHLETVNGITVFETLADFLATSEIAMLFSGLDAKSQHTTAIKRFFATSLFQLHLSTYLYVKDNLIEDTYIQEGNIEGIEKIDIRDCYGVSINYPKAELIKEISFGEVMQVKEGHFSIGISFFTLASVHYCADYSDYINLSDERKLVVEETSMNGDGVCDLQEDRTVSLSGHVEVRFDPKFTAEDLSTHIEYLDTERTKIYVELDMKEGTII